MRTSIFTALIATSVLVSACATSMPTSAPTGQTVSADEVVYDASVASRQYSDDDILAIMIGGGARDPEKFAMRLQKAKESPLGSKRNPVRVHMPRGQKDYLNRLICPSGEFPGFRREGSFGAGPYETIVDGYRLSCDGEEMEALVYMDMYHPKHIEYDAVPGFTIDEP